MEEKKKSSELKRVLVSVAIGAAVIALAVFASLGLVAQRKPPVQAEVTERAIRVDVLTVRHEAMPVIIAGYGEAKSRDEIVVSPEVSGRVQEVHPRLNVGEIIPAGEVLFTIDPREYRAHLAEAEANVVQWKATVSRLEKQYQTDKARRSTYESTREIAKRDFERISKLFREDNIESETAAGRAEKDFNAAEDAYNQFVQTLELYPLRIEEARSSLSAAEASLERAQLDLDRTTVEAPFNARLKTVDVEQNEWVSPGTPVLTLADDSVLEIDVPLNSVDASQWLKFDAAAAPQGRAWFRSAERVPVEVAWSEALTTNVWQGTLDRVARYDEETRTVTVVVEVEGDEAQTPKSGNLPLVEGMFCRVRIPGKVASSVVRLPAEVVAFDSDASGMRSVYVAKPDAETSAVRLETRKVKESHVDGQFVYISEGLKDGEQVIVTRLVNPLERTLLDVRDAPVAAQ